MLTNDTTVIVDSTNRLTSVFKGKVRIEGFLRAFLTGHQEIENVLQDMLEQRSVLTAVGAQLDIIGEIVGQPREGRDDDEYRIYIIAKIGQNNSKGTATDVISIFNLLTGSTNPFLVELYNATVEIYADVDISALDTAAIHIFMGLVVSAGVQIGAIGYFDPDDYFGFEGDPDALGFGDTSDPAVGGTFASLVF